MTEHTERLILALAQCRKVVLTMHGPEPARSGVTKIYGGDGSSPTLREWSHPARPATYKVVLFGTNASVVRFRQRRGETLEGMLWRALSELSNRELNGMPKPSPQEQQRRKHRRLLHQADAVRVQ